MKVIVYFESGKHSDAVAQFNSEELYVACFPILEALARKSGCIVTESCREDETIIGS